MRIKYSELLTDGHSKVALQCQFPQTFTMVKAWAEIAVPLVGITIARFVLATKIVQLWSFIVNGNTNFVMHPGHSFQKKD